MTNSPDPEQVHRFSHQADALDVEEVVWQYYPSMCRLAATILDDPDDAEDAAQEAMIAAAKSLHTFRGRSALKTWLFAITLNKCKRHLRKRKGRRNLLASLQKSNDMLDWVTESPEKAVSQSREDARLWSAVDSLDEKHRLVVILKYVFDLPIQDIAEILNVNSGTIHSRLHYARQRLQVSLRDEYPHRAGRR